ncbi:MAG: NAD(P)H-dependent oxidoreductase [Methanobacteriota archaeon]|nr:MAG: NAD(P)H-dependent oxidoreductase [Euryarchaeota archaeon]
MVKMLICYYSRSGNTRKMARLIEKGARPTGVEVDVKDVKDVTPAALLKYDCVVIGSPTYYGLMSAEVKALLDKSIRYHGRLDGKVGGAFSSSYNVGGGNETTIMAILESLLIHGMVVCGDPDGDHYGPVSIGKPNRRVEAVCRRYGERVAELAKRLHG